MVSIFSRSEKSSKFLVISGGGSLVSSCAKYADDIIIEPVSVFSFITVWSLLIQLQAFQILLSQNTSSTFLQISSRKQDIIPVLQSFNSTTRDPRFLYKCNVNVVPA